MYKFYKVFILSFVPENVVSKNLSITLHYNCFVQSYVNQKLLLHHIMTLSYISVCGLNLTKTSPFILTQEQFTGRQVDKSKYSQHAHT